MTRYVVRPVLAEIVDEKIVDIHYQDDVFLYVSNSQICEFEKLFISLRRNRII